MKPETSKLFRDLQRYRFLLGCVTDRQVGDALKTLIREGEGRLRATARKEDERPSGVIAA
jgi:hypothetical protein